jgi:hypothetical protein
MNPMLDAGHFSLKWYKYSHHEMHRIQFSSGEITTNMNSRQRFHETLSFGSPDRVPLFPEGMRDEVLRKWTREGLTSKNDFYRMFVYDEWEEIETDLAPHPPLRRGILSKSDLTRFQRSLDAHASRRLPTNWKKKVRAWQNREHVLMLRVHRGLFLTFGVDGWRSFAELVRLLCDEQELVRQSMQIQGKFAAALAERILNDVEVDAVIFSEPISSTHGSLISPSMYEDLVLCSYQPLLDVTRKFGIDTIIFRTYANSRAILPVVFKTDINCLWSCECESDGMDYRQLRNSLGNRIRLIGGIDADVLLTDRERIQCELEEKAIPLLAQGGFIPLADGRVRENVPFDNYVYYRKLLEKLVLEGDHSRSSLNAE